MRRPFAEHGNRRNSYAFRKVALSDNSMDNHRAALKRPFLSRRRSNEGWQGITAYYIAVM